MKRPVLLTIMLITAVIVSFFATEIVRATNETYRWSSTDAIEQYHENGSLIGLFGFARGEGDARVYSRSVDSLRGDGSPQRCIYEISTSSPYRSGEIRLNPNGSSPDCTNPFGPNPTTISGEFPGEITAEISIANLSHIHIQSFSQEGINTTGEMNDGDTKDLIFFLIRPNGEIVWQICQTRAGGNDISTHWFHPSYGRPINFRNDSGSKTSIDNVANNKATCKDSEAPAPGGTFVARPDWIYDGKIRVGQTWTIRAVGVGGDLPLFPDSNSQYNDTMTIKLISVGVAEYTSSGVEERDGKFVEGDPVVRRITVPQGACPPTATLSASNPCPTPSDGEFVFNVFSVEGGGLIAIINNVLNFFVEQMRQIILQLNRLVQNVITIPHSYFTREGANKGVVQAWDVARGISNTLFVLVLIVIAMANILRYQIEKYDIRAAIPRLVVAVILTNFSLLFIGVLVDLTNVATIAIKSGFDAIAQTDSTAAVDKATSSIAGVAAILLIVLMFVLLVLAVLWLVILLTFRVAVIFAMAALAPIAFMFYALPATSGMLLTWWKNLVRFLIMGPVIMFLLAMSGTIITSIQREVGTDDIALLISFFVAIGFVAIAGMVPVMLGGKSFAYAGGLAKRIGALAGRRAAATRAARTLAGAMQTVPVLRHIPGVKAVGTRLGAVSAGVGAVAEKRMEAAASVMNTPMLRRRFKSTRSGSEKFAAGKVLDERSALKPEEYTEFIDGSGAKTNEAIGIAVKAAQEKDPTIAGAIGLAGGKKGEPGAAYKRATRQAIDALPSHFKDTDERVSRTAANKFATFKPELLANIKVRKNLRVTDPRQLTQWSPQHFETALQGDLEDYAFTTLSKIIDAAPPDIRNKYGKK